MGVTNHTLSIYFQAFRGGQVLRPIPDWTRIGRRLRLPSLGRRRRNCGSRLLTRLLEGDSGALRYAGRSPIAPSYLVAPIGARPLL